MLSYLLFSDLVEQEFWTLTKVLLILISRSLLYKYIWTLTNHNIRKHGEVTYLWLGCHKNICIIQRFCLFVHKIKTIINILQENEKMIYLFLFHFSFPLFPLSECPKWIYFSVAHFLVKRFFFLSLIFLKPEKCLSSHKTTIDPNLICTT